MENQWTFADLNSSGWVHPTFLEKEDAIAECKRVYGKRTGTYLVIGQLKEFCGTFYVENQELVENKKPQ